MEIILNDEELKSEDIELDEKITFKDENKKIKKEKMLKKEKKSKIDKNQNLDQTLEYFNVDTSNLEIESVKDFKNAINVRKKLKAKYSRDILNKKIISTQNQKPNKDEYVIELINVRKSYVSGSMITPVLKGINIKIKKEKFIVILGPSGSGKTTLLNAISGLDDVSYGDVFVVGYNLSLLKDSHLTLFRRENIGFIFQQYNLLSNLTSKENAEVGENLSTDKENKLSIEEIFETIGMTEQMNKYPHQMSGGQQQRVSIARALAKNPKILFGDEPTGALDEEMGRKVLEILLDVNKKFKTTIIIVTHNANIAEVADTVIHVKNGLIDSIRDNPNPKTPDQIDWS